MIVRDLIEELQRRDPDEQVFAGAHDFRVRVLRVEQGSQHLGFIEERVTVLFADLPEPTNEEHEHNRDLCTDCDDLAEEAAEEVRDAVRAAL